MYSNSFTKNKIISMQALEEWVKKKGKFKETSPKIQSREQIKAKNRETAYSACTLSKLRRSSFKVWLLLENPVSMPESFIWRSDDPLSSSREPPRPCSNCNILACLFEGRVDLREDRSLVLSRSPRKTRKHRVSWSAYWY